MDALHVSSRFREGQKTEEEPQVQDLTIPLICIVFFFPALIGHPSVISEVLQRACKVGRKEMTVSI